LLFFYSYILSITTRTTFAKCYTQYAIHAIRVAYRGVYSSAPISKAGRKPDQMPEPGS